MGVTVNSPHAVSATPCPSGGGLLTLCPCSSVRSLSWETVLHKLLQYESFPWAAALHKLPQRGSLPRGAVLQEQAAPVSPWGYKPCQQTCSGVGSSLHGSAGLDRSLLQCGAPHRVTNPFRHPPAPVWGPFHRLQVDICSTMDVHGLQGDNLPHHGLHHELQGKTLCSGTSSTSSPSFFTDLGVCRVVFFTSFHSFLFTAVSLQFFFFPFFNMLSQRRYHRR